MKKISILLLSTFLLFSCADDKIWHTNLEEAIEVAEEENKPILLQFSGSDWCKWCIKLNEEVMFKKEFLDYAKENIILVNLDFPRSIQQTVEIKAYNRALANKYGIKGYPTVLLLDKSGNVDKRTGYQPGGPLAYIKHIKEVYATN